MLSTEPTKKEISGYKTTYTFNKPTSDIKINFGNEKHAYFDKEGFFAADFSPEIPLIKRNLPSHFDIALDISTSSESDFLIWERAALEILEQNEAQIQTFSLIFFNIGTDFDLSKRMINNAENRIKLRKILKKIKFFGGSDLSNLFKSISKLKNKTEVEDGLLLFTNGFSSWGDDNIFLSIRQNKAYHQIFTFYSADNAKIAVLEKIAAENRGTNFYVKNVKTCQAAGRNIGYEAFSVVLPKITSGEILVYDCKRSVYAGEKVRIVGRIASLSDNYELEIQFKNNDKTLMTAAKLKKTDYQTLPRLFGLAVNEHLRIEEVKYKNLIIENAEAHAIVGKYTFFYFDKDNFFGEKRKSKRIETANLVNRINHFEMKSEKDAFKNWLHQVIYSKYQNVKSFDKLQNSFRKMPDSAFVIKHKPKKIISQASSEFKKLTHHQALPNPLGYSFENYEKSARLFEEAQKKHSKLQWLSGLSWFLEKDNNDFGNLTFAVRECLKIGEFHDAWHLSVRLMTLYPNDAVCYELAIEAAKGMKNAPLAEAVDSLRNNLLSLKKQ